LYSILTPLRGHAIAALCVMPTCPVLLQVVPHETLAEHLLLPSDQLIRDTDVPERLQLLGSMYTEEADTAETAEWIYEQLFSVDAPVSGSTGAGWLSGCM
jgi:hypothetical protein